MKVKIADITIDTNEICQEYITMLKKRSKHESVTKELNAFIDHMILGKEAGRE